MALVENGTNGKHIQSIKGPDPRQREQREQGLIRKELQEKGPHFMVFTVESAYDCGHNGAGGAARTVSEHWKGLNNHGIETTLVTPTPNRPYNYITDHRVHLYELKEMMELTGHVGDPNHISSDSLVEVYSHPDVRKQLMDNVNGGVVLAHFYTSRGLLESGENVAYFHHSPYTNVREQYDPRMIGPDADVSKKSPVRTEIEEWSLKHAPSVGVFTEAEACLTQEAYSHHNLEGKMKAIPLGIDMDRFNPEVKRALRLGLRKQHEIPEDAKVLYMQARVGASMGQLPLAELFAREMQNTPGLYLAIVGDPARGEEVYYDRLKTLQEKSNGRIVLTGALCDQEGHSLGDISVGFKLETFGYSNLEAMAVGNPLVTQDNPIHREVYGDEKGVLYVDLPSLLGEIRNHRTGEQTERFLEFVKNPKSLEEARRWNPLIVKKYPWEASINKLERVMHETLKSK